MSLPDADSMRDLRRLLLRDGTVQDREDVIGEIALERGWVDPQILRECEEELHRRRAAGESGLGMAEVLLERGRVTRDQIDGFLRAAAPAKMEGRRLGKYVFGRKLGKGGMGTVFLAQDRELDRPIALKILHDDHAHPEILQRLHREALILARLSHPNIVDVHEVGVFDDVGGDKIHFIAMEYVDGGTFEELLAAGKTPRADLLRMFEDVARAAGHAHAEGIVHRDLKPSNILVDRQGRARVSDFGLARARGFGERLTQSAAVMGTPLYMAPEQVAGHTRLTNARADVYALGVILYEILAGRVPFAADTPGEFYRQVQQEDPPRPSRFRRGIEPELENICFKALEKEPARRYANGTEFADELARFREGRAVRARSATVRRWVVRRKAGVFGVASVIVVSALLALVVAHSRKRNAQTEADRVRAEARLREAELYFPIEKDLALLRMSVYRKDFRFDETEFARYRDLEDRIRKQMNATGPSARGWYLIGRCWEVVSDSRGAVEAFDEALKIDERYAPALLQKGRLLLQRALVEGRIRKIGEDRSEAVLSCAREGARLVRSGIGEEAMEADLAEAYVDVVERSADSRYTAQPMMEKWKGEWLVEEFQLLEGIVHQDPGRVASVLEAVPSYAEAHFWHGIILGSLNECDAAMAGLTRAVEINPRFAAAYEHRGHARGQKGDPDGAIADFTRAVELDPKRDSAYYRRGIQRKEKGDWAGAIADYTTAIEINPGFTLAYNARGNAWYVKGEFGRAVADYTRAIAVNAKYANAYAGRGNAYVSKEDLDRALADYTTALEIDPEDPDTRFNRGIVRTRKGDFDRAIDDFSRVIALRPKDAETRAQRGIALYKRGDIDAAVSDWNRALELDARCAWARLNRGIVRHWRGDLDGAIDDLERALDLGNPDPQYRKLAEETLAKARLQRDRQRKP